MNANGNLKHGQHGTLTYARWKSMMQRCNDPKHARYAYYGGRGITVCERWQQYPAFLEDVGECPSTGMTLDRLKNDVGYEPGNCQWATKADQNRNRSHCVRLTHNGVTMNATDWALAVGMAPNTLLQRLYLGWSTERALTTPVKSRGVHK